MRDFHGVLDLRACMRKDANIRARSSASHVARVGKETGGAPQKLLTTRLDVLLKVLGNRVKHGVGLAQRSKLWRNVSVMETEAVNVAFLQELKERISATQAVAQRVCSIVPGHERCGGTKRIGESITHGVPIAGSKAHMLAHGLAVNQCIGVVMAKGERISGFRTFIANTIDERKGGLHIAILPRLPRSRSPRTEGAPCSTPPYIICRSS